VNVSPTIPKPAPLPQTARVLAFVAWLGASLLAGLIGSVATLQAGAFYSQLVRPGWAPPAELFAPVWTGLYALMGVSAWLVWSVAGFRPARVELRLFIVQLGVNALWSWLFFAWRLGAVSFSEICLLIALVSVTLVLFWRKRPLAGALLIPYLLWLVYAAALNYSVWRLNPQLL